MKKLYIIPGWGESSKYKIYQSLGSMAVEKGYEVVFYDIDWNKTFSSQVFAVQEDCTLVGFSLGAIFARMIAQKFKCKKLICASMTPVNSFADETSRTELVKLLGREIVDDISSSLKPTHLAEATVVMYGDKEGEIGDIIVKQTGHRLNARYNKAIVELL